MTAKVDRLWRDARSADPVRILKGVGTLNEVKADIPPETRKKLMARIVDLLHNSDPKVVNAGVVGARNFPDFADQESGPLVAAALLPLLHRTDLSDRPWALGALGCYLPYLNDTDRLSTTRALLALTQSADAVAVRIALGALAEGGGPFPQSEVLPICHRVAQMRNQDLSRYDSDLPRIMAVALKSATPSDQAELMGVIVRAARDCYNDSLGRFAKTLVANEPKLTRAAKRVLVEGLMALYEDAERLELSHSRMRRYDFLLILAACRPVMEPGEFSWACAAFMAAVKPELQLSEGYVEFGVVAAWANLLPPEPLAELVSVADERLKGRQTSLRSMIVWWLARWLPRAPQWIAPEVRRILEGLKDDPDEYVRDHARKALGI